MRISSIFCQPSSALCSELNPGERKRYLSEHEIPLGELHEHLFRAKRVVELQLEVFDLDFRVRELDERGFILRCIRPRQSR